ncbi:MAG: GSCFA domain-containing protein, partial [Pseudomonadota bacterium]
YTTRQLRQLVEDCTTLAVHEGAIWEQEGRWFDGLRPGIEPQGFVDRNAVLLHRRSHLRRVREMFRKANLFVFTLGLTEAWQDIGTGIVFPTVPGTVAGTFDSAQHAFVNFGVLDVISDLEAIIDCVKTLNRGIQFLFTVSPVSLVATASGFHVSQATAYSKSVLRTAAGEVVRKTACADYFPSYEIITSPMFRSQFLAPNCRAVTPEGVDTVMAAFFAAYPDLVAQSSENVVRPDFTTPEPEDDDLMCEEILLQGFAAS